MSLGTACRDDRHGKEGFAKPPCRPGRKKGAVGARWARGQCRGTTLTRLGRCWARRGRCWTRHGTGDKGDRTGDKEHTQQGSRCGRQGNDKGRTHALLDAAGATRGATRTALGQAGSDSDDAVRCACASGHHTALLGRNTSADGCVEGRRWDTRGATLEVPARHWCQRDTCADTHNKGDPTHDKGHTRQGRCRVRQGNDTGPTQAPLDAAGPLQVATRAALGHAGSDTGGAATARGATPAVLGATLAVLDTTAAPLHVTTTLQRHNTCASVRDTGPARRDKGPCCTRHRKKHNDQGPEMSAFRWRGARVPCSARRRRARRPTQAPGSPHAIAYAHSSTDSRSESAY